MLEAGLLCLVEDIRVERIEDTPLVHPPRKLLPSNCRAASALNANRLMSWQAADGPRRQFCQCASRVRVHTPTRL